MINILLVNNEPIAGAGLRSVFAEVSDFGFLAQDNQITAAIDRLEGTEPDVVVVDARDTRDELFERLGDLTTNYPRPAVLLLAPAADIRKLQLALASGISGYLTKPLSAGLVIDAVRTLYEGGVALSSSIGVQLFALVTPSSDTAPIDSLTTQEYRVLDELAAGRSNDEIACDLSLAPATVKKHLSSLLHRTGARDRLQAGLLGWQHGLGRRATTDGSAVN